MNWNKREEKTFKKLYLETNLTLEEIAKVVGRSVPALNNRLSKLQIKRRRQFKYTCPSEVTPALARIHAHVSADGFLYTVTEKDIYGPWAKYRKNPIRKRYIIGYSNTKKELLKEFAQDIFEVFGLKIISNKNKHEVRVKSKKLWEFLQAMGAGGSYEWTIPDSIIEGSKNIKKSWLRAFFDDEARFDKNEKGELLRIRLKSVNKKGVCQVADILRTFVPCHITPRKGLYTDKTVYLNIRRKDINNFFIKIGSLTYRFRKLPA